MEGHDVGVEPEDGVGGCPEDGVLVDRSRRWKDPRVHVLIGDAH